MGGNKVGALKILDEYLQELGHYAPRIGLPAEVLRRRISTRIPAAQSPHSSPLVGRASAVATIGLSIRETQRKVGRGYLITGDQGIGKTRLIQELARAAALDGIRVVAFECAPTDSQLPLSAVTAFVSLLRNLPGAIGCSPTSMNHVDKLIASGAEALHSAAATLLPYSALRTPILDLLSAVTHEHSLLVVIDAIDRADASSLHLVTDLISACKEMSVLFLLAGRSSNATSILAAAGTDLIPWPLLPLSRTESITLLRQLTVSAPALENATCRFYGDSSDGNPAVIHDLASHWCEYGPSLPIPSLLRSTIERRIAALGRSALETLQVVTLFAKHATVERLSRTITLAKSEISEAVNTLERSNLVCSTNGVVDLAHDMLREIVSALLPAGSVRQLHRRIAIALRAEIDRPHDAPILWDCAEHFRLAGDTQDAISLLTQSAARLLEIGQPAEALTICERAATWCATDKERLGLQETLIPVLRSLGDLNRAESCAADALRLRMSLRHSAGRPWAEWQIAALEARMYSLGDPSPILDAALTCLADECTALALRARAGVCALICAYNLTDAGRLSAVHDQLLALSDKFEFPASDRATVELVFHSAVGDLDKATIAGSELVALTRATGSRGAIAQSLRRYAKALRLMGRFAEAHGALSEALELARRMGSRSYVLAAANMTAQTYIEQDDFDSARQILNTTLTRDDRRLFPYRATDAIVFRVMIALAGGEEVEARRLVRSREFKQSRRALNAAGDRGAYYSLAITVLLSLSESATPGSERDIATLEKRFLRLQRLGEQDFVAFALGSALMVRSDPARTNQLLRDYTKLHRRERYPLPRYLTKLTRPELALQPQTPYDARAMGEPAWQ